MDGKYGDVNFGFKRCITLSGALCGKEKKSPIYSSQRGQTISSKKCALTKCQKQKLNASSAGIGGDQRKYCSGLFQKINA